METTLFSRISVVEFHLSYVRSGISLRGVSKTLFKHMLRVLTKLKTATTNLDTTTRKAISLQTWRASLRSRLDAQEVKREITSAAINSPQGIVQQAYTAWICTSNACEYI
ncbi:hypothetical protein V2G26_008196 [Clonostachys chloroleuca]